MTSENIILLITAILLVLVVIKTYLFFSSTNNRSLYNWFFFSNYAVYNSRNDKSRKSKMLQNRLTWFIIGITLIDIVVFILLRDTL